MLVYSLLQSFCLLHLARADFAGVVASGSQDAGIVASLVKGYQAQDGLASAMDIQQSYAVFSKDVMELVDLSDSVDAETLHQNAQSVGNLLVSITGLLDALTEQANSLDTVKDIVKGDIAGLGTPADQIVVKLRDRNTNCQDAQTLSGFVATFAEAFSNAAQAYGVNPIQTFPAIECSEDAVLTSPSQNSSSAPTAASSAEDNGKVPTAGPEGAVGQEPNLPDNNASPESQSTTPSTSIDTGSTLSAAAGLGEQHDSMPAVTSGPPVSDSADPSPLFTRYHQVGEPQQAPGFGPPGFTTSEPSPARSSVGSGSANPAAAGGAARPSPIQGVQSSGSSRESSAEGCNCESATTVTVTVTHAAQPDFCKNDKHWVASFLCWLSQTTALN